MDLKQNTNSTRTLMKRKNNALLLNQINLNDTSVQQTHYSPCRQGGNMILNRNTNRHMKVINVRNLSAKTGNELYDEPVSLKSTTKVVTNCVKFDQIPDDDAIPISSDEESKVKTNSSPFILKTILNAPKTIIYPKRTRYKTPFKPIKDAIRYIRKPISYMDREEMLQNFAKRKETKPNLTLLDCCVMIGKSVILDHTIMIPPLEFKAQLNGTGDTVQKAKLMPGSKQEIYRLQTGFVKLFANPAHRITNPKLLQLFHTNCITNKQPNSDAKLFNLSPVEQDSLRDLIPKTKFGCAYDKKIDTNDHVYSKTLDSSPVSVSKPRKTRSDSLDSVDLLSRKNSIEIAQIYSDFNEHSLDSDEIVNIPMNLVETVLIPTQNDLILDVIEEPIDNIQITNDSVQSEHILIESDQTLEDGLNGQNIKNCDILGI